MAKILALYGSPRKNGNTDHLMRAAVSGARSAGADVDEVFLRDLNMSPCMEIYGCSKTGRCAIDDDFQQVYDKILPCDAVLLGSPMFFYTVSAHTKILMDRCQSLWVKRYWIDREPLGKASGRRRGLFLSVGATKGKQLFDGALMTVRYFFDAIDANLWRSLLYRNLGGPTDVQKHPEYLEEAETAGREIVQS